MNRRGLLAPWVNSWLAEDNGVPLEREAHCRVKNALACGRWLWAGPCHRLGELTSSTPARQDFDPPRPGNGGPWSLSCRPSAEWLQQHAAAQLCRDEVAASVCSRAPCPSGRPWCFAPSKSGVTAGAGRAQSIWRFQPRCVSGWRGVLEPHNGQRRLAAWRFTLGKHARAMALKDRFAQVQAQTLTDTDTDTDTYGRPGDERWRWLWP